MTTSDRCHTCGQTHFWHDEHQPRHQFNDGTMPVADTFGKKLPGGGRSQGASDAQTEVTEVPWPFDPVLRQALITKGVLTPDDLTEAERTIRAVTAQFVQEKETTT